jgi:hypothetical protein
MRKLPHEPEWGRRRILARALHKRRSPHVNCTIKSFYFNYLVFIACCIQNILASGLPLPNNDFAGPRGSLNDVAHPEGERVRDILCRE